VAKPTDQQKQCETDVIGAQADVPAGCRSGSSDPPAEQEQANRVLQELARVAFGDADKKEGGMEVKMTNKMRALELLGKHFGLFSEKSPETEEGVQIIDDVSTSDKPDFTGIL